MKTMEKLKLEAERMALEEDRSFDLAYREVLAELVLYKCLSIVDKRIKKSKTKGQKQGSYNAYADLCIHFDIATDGPIE